MSPIIQVFFLLFLVTSTKAQERCPSFCKFRFCFRLLREGNIVQPDNRPLLLRPGEKPQGPFPCLLRPNGQIQILRNVTGGEPFVAPARSGDRFLRISKYRRRDVEPNFSADHFRWTEFPITQRSTVTRRTSEGNQDEFLEELCVRMPITSFLRFNRDGTVRKRVNLRGRRNCVGFRSRIALLDVEFIWDSTDDYDVRLLEPNGFEISRFGAASTSPNGGRLIRDSGGNVCQLVFGQERVRYLQGSTVESGEYTITVDNNRVCRPVTNWTLRVAYLGNLILDESGVLRDSGAEVLVRKFNIP